MSTTSFEPANPSLLEVPRRGDGGVRKGCAIRDATQTLQGVLASALASGVWLAYRVRGLHRRPSAPSLQPERCRPRAFRAAPSLVSVTERTREIRTPHQ